jgi:hypothetical protein
MMKVVVKTNTIDDDPFLNMVIKHESLHVLGLGHTTRRKDRLDYVTSLEKGMTRSGHIIGEKFGREGLVHRQEKGQYWLAHITRRKDTVYKRMYNTEIKGTVARDFCPLLFSIKRTYLGP